MSEGQGSSVLMYQSEMDTCTLHTRTHLRVTRDAPIKHIHTHNAHRPATTFFSPLECAALGLGSFSPKVRPFVPLLLAPFSLYKV